MKWNKCIYVIPDEDYRVKNLREVSRHNYWRKTNPLRIDKKVKKIDMMRQKSYKGRYWVIETHG
jgi:hypothetical protein